MNQLTSTVLNAVQQAAKQLSTQLMRHGAAVLAQDVLRSASAWLPAIGVASLQQQLFPVQAAQAPAAAGVPANFGPADLHLSGDQLDAAFHTLRLLNSRLKALSSMAHEPQSSSSTTGININAESWLVAHKAVQQRAQERHSWQYGYELRLTNTLQEPLKLLRKAWAVQDINGCSRYRESEGLGGVQPVIQPSSTLSCRTGITLEAIKGSMHGHFELQGLESGRRLLAHVRAFALTPTPMQLADPQVTHFTLG